MGHGRGARGRRRGLAGLRGDAPSNISDQAPLVWRAPERPVGLAAVPVAAAGPAQASHSNLAPPVWSAPEGPEGTAAVLVGGGGACPG